MTCVVLLGPPGAGKGTQARHISQVLGVPHISTGAIFRHHMSQGTPLGKQAEVFIDKGEFVPDEVTNQMVGHFLSMPNLADGFLLDGFPRNLNQAHFLTEVMKQQGRKIDCVLEIQVPQAQLIERLLARAEVEHRPDDTEPVIRHRMEVYREQTAPISDYYRQQEVLHQVDGLGSVEQVQSRIDQVIGTYTC